jgi:hypothetical protein
MMRMKMMWKRMMWNTMWDEEEKGMEMMWMTRMMWNKMWMTKMKRTRMIWWKRVMWTGMEMKMMRMMWMKMGLFSKLYRLEVEGELESESEDQKKKNGKQTKMQVVLEGSEGQLGHPHQSFRDIVSPRKGIGKLISEQEVRELLLGGVRGEVVLDHIEGLFDREKTSQLAQVSVEELEADVDTEEAVEKPRCDQGTVSEGSIVDFLRQERKDKEGNEEDLLETFQHLINHKDHVLESFDHLLVLVGFLVELHELRLNRSLLSVKEVRTGSDDLVDHLRLSTSRRTQDHEDLVELQIFMILGEEEEAQCLEQLLIPVNRFAQEVVRKPLFQMKGGGREGGREGG